jgi:hypothetical protein
MSSRTYRPGIVVPALLIGLGILFLLENLGLLGWSVWQAAQRLWPLLLVAWGLELMLGRRSAWGGAIAVVLILMLLAGGVMMLGRPATTSQDMLVINVPKLETDQAQLMLDPAIGYVKVDVLEDQARYLIDGEVRPFPGERVRQEFDRSGNYIDGRVETSGAVLLPIINFNIGRPTWDFKLHPGTNYNLTFDLGAGKADLFLAELLVEGLQIDTGIGQTIVYLPERGNYDAVIDAGLGHVVVYLPDNLGVRLHVNTGIGSSDLPNDFRRAGDAYLSPNYDEAEMRIDVDISLGIGSVEVR